MRSISEQLGLSTPFCEDIMSLYLPCCFCVTCSQSVCTAALHESASSGCRRQGGARSMGRDHQSEGVLLAHHAFSAGRIAHALSMCCCIYAGGLHTRVHMRPSKALDTNVFLCLFLSMIFFVPMNLYIVFISLFSTCMYFSNYHVPRTHLTVLPIA